MVDHERILREIYSQIYTKDPSFTINVFLCGASTSSKGSLRDLLFQKMRTNPKFNVVFPEWLFASLNWKDYNLLNLESELAAYVDAVVIPLEGYGTFAELGAFSQNGHLLPKLIVLNDIKHSRSKSFVNMGPLSLIKKEYPSNLKYYEKDSDDNILDSEELVSTLVNKLLRHHKTADSKLDVSNLFNLSRFMLFIIAIYQPITKFELSHRLTKFRMNQTIKKHLISPSLAVLIYKEYIRMRTFEQKDYITLSETGHDFVFEELLPNLGVVKTFSKIRGSIISKRGRNKYKFKYEVGAHKHLVGIIQ